MSKIEFDEEGNLRLKRITYKIKHDEESKELLEKDKREKIKDDSYK